MLSGTVDSSFPFGVLSLSLHGWVEMRILCVLFGTQTTSQIWVFYSTSCNGKCSGAPWHEKWLPMGEAGSHQKDLQNSAERKQSYECWGELHLTYGWEISACLLQLICDERRGPSCWLFHKFCSDMIYMKRGKSIFKGRILPMDQKCTSCFHRWRQNESVGGLQLELPHNNFHHHISWTSDI